MHLVEGEHLELITLGGAKKKPLVLTIQESGGIGKTVEAGVKAVIDLLPVVSEYKQVRLPAKHIMLGTNCGGSDGNSGVTANPASVSHQTWSSSRAARRSSGRLRRFTGPNTCSPGRVPRGRREARRANQVVGVVHRHLRGGDQQQPVGREQEGGLTTIYEKSLGAIAGNAAAVVDVVQYAEPVRARAWW